MKNKLIICGLLIGGLVGGALAPSARAADKGEKAEQAKLKAQATVSKKTAKKTALAEVKNRGLTGAKVKEAGLEEENGKLIWSFDVATKGTKDITEVQVDANSGAIVSVTTESAADEAKEKKAEASEKKAKKEKDDDEKDEKK